MRWFDGHCFIVMSGCLLLCTSTHSDDGADVDAELRELMELGSQDVQPVEAAAEATETPAEAAAVFKV